MVPRYTLYFRLAVLCLVTQPIAATAQDCSELINRTTDKFTGEVVHAGETRAPARDSYMPGVVRSILLRKSSKAGVDRYQARFVVLSEPDQNYTHQGVTLLLSGDQQLRFDNVTLERTTHKKYVYVTGQADLSAEQMALLSKELVTDLRFGTNDSRLSKQSATWMRKVVNCLLTAN